MIASYRDAVFTIWFWGWPQQTPLKATPDPVLLNFSFAVVRMELMTFCVPGKYFPLEPHTQHAMPDIILVGTQKILNHSLSRFPTPILELSSWPSYRHNII